MKKFLLMLAISLQVVHAQPEGAQASAFSGGEGVNGTVYAVAIQSDGKVVIGGRFSAVNGVPRNNIARLNKDGTIDPSFANTTESGVNGQVNAIVVQAEGGIVVGGNFSQVSSFQTMNLGRYNVDGTVDKNFGGAVSGEPGANGAVQALALQPDGKIVVGGNFSTVFGQPRRSLARINTDGTLDGPVTPPNSMAGVVYATQANADGFVAGGEFTRENQDARSILRVAAPQD